MTQQGSRRASAPRQHRSPLQTQLGAVAIEFAFLFIIFFVVLYGIISYAFVMLLQQSLTQAAAEGVRFAARVDPINFTTTAAYQTAANTLAKKAAMATLSWLPQPFQDRVSGAWVAPVWSASSQTINNGAGAQTLTFNTVTVKVTYPDYAGAPFMPLLSFPGLGTIPQIPQNLVAQATLTAGP